MTAERRAAQRYTLSHLAHDVKNQTGIGEPIRDWFPISFMGSFTDWADVTHGAEKEFGQLTCGCHPNCGVGMAIMIDKETKEAVPVTAFLKAEQLAKDVAAVSDAGRGRFLSVAGMALAVVRNYDSFKSPTHFKLSDLLKKFDKTFGATKSAEKGKYGKVEGDRTTRDIEKRRADRWNFLFIAGMWFQDLFNYDFRRTEMCIIPYATQQGEISFCAYNTGIGWRNIIEKMHMTATLTKWYEEHGRHEIFAGGKAVQLTSTAHSLKLNEEAVRAGRADRPRRSRASRRTPARKSWRRASTRTTEDARRAGHDEEDGQALRAARAQGAADAQDSGPRRAEEEARRQPVLHKPRCSLPCTFATRDSGAGGQPPAFSVTGLGRSPPSQREVVPARAAADAEADGAVLDHHVADDGNRPSGERVGRAAVDAIDGDFFAEQADLRSSASGIVRGCARCRSARPP